MALLIFIVFKIYRSPKKRFWEKSLKCHLLQSNGMCLGMRGTLRYQKYGRASTCKDGKGYSSSASDVYQIGGKCFIQGEGSGNSRIRAFSWKKLLEFPEQSPFPEGNENSGINSFNHERLKRWEWKLFPENFKMTLMIQVFNKGRLSIFHSVFMFCLEWDSCFC